MDVDAVLARRPELALVDELAHTNVPGSGRNEKRWQDVMELIDAGIAVITTVNVQHLESIADAVERMTGTRVRERVPDWVVRKADQLELIDSSPEALRRRMVHGNIYPAGEGARRADALLPLREPGGVARAGTCGSSPTRPRRSSSPTSATGIPTSCGRPGSGSWWRSPEHTGPTP